MNVLKLGLAVIVAIGMQILFYIQTLPNSQPRCSRLDIIDQALIPTSRDHVNLYAAAANQFTSWKAFPERTPIFLHAFLIWIACFATGDLFLRFAFPARRLSPVERVVFSFGIGVGWITLAVQFLGLAGILSRPVAIGLVAIPFVLWNVVRRIRPDSKAPAAPTEQSESRPSLLIRGLLLCGVLPFLLFGILAAALPTSDYDALAYHLLGPKEYFQNGRITFLPHNVYTTFPFLTEMIALFAMTLAGDWQMGGLVGPVALWMFAPMTGLAVGLLGSRFFGREAGWFAATIYLTTPWIYRLSVIPYVEGALLFYTTLAIYAAVAARTVNANRVHWSLAAGLLAGGSIACKYPGLVMTAVPVLALIATAPRVSMRERWSMIGFGLIGSVLMAGPWLLRNLLWTGNPFYPLAYSIFGGTGWSAEKAAKFASGHQAIDYTLPSILDQVYDIAARSDWQTSLIAAFAPIALLCVHRRQSLVLWSVALYLFVAFWGLTHRLDRFWLPIEPIAAVLAGAGMAWNDRKLWKGFVAASLAFAVFYNFAYCTTVFCGRPDVLKPLAAIRTENATFWPAIQLAEAAPTDQSTLFVGFAAVYDFPGPARYNTVFDDNLFEKLVRSPEGNLLDAESIRRNFAKEGIEQVVIDWSWIRRYRSPGNYGFTDFITPALLRSLVEQRVLFPIALDFHRSVELYRVVGSEESAP